MPAPPLPTARAAPAILALPALITVLTVLAGSVLGLPRPAAAGVDRWSGGGPPGGRVTGLTADPSSPAELVASLVGGGLFRSRDGGVSWQPARRNAGAFDLLALARDPVDPEVLYAASFTAGVFRSLDGGDSWEPFAEGLAGLGVKALLAAPDGVVYAGTSQGRVLRRGPGEARWRPTGQPLGIPVFSLAVSPADPRRLLAGTAHGLFRTADGGATWAASDSGLPSRFVKFVGFTPGEAQTAWAGTGAGVAVSSDAGRTWRTAGEGLPETEIRTLAFVPEDPRTLWAGGAAGVFASGDGGRTWEDRSAGLPQREVLALSRAGGRLWAGLAGAGVVWSDDGGRSWHPERRGLEAAAVTALAVTDRGAETVWAGTDGSGVAAGRGGEPSWSFPGPPPDEGRLLALAVFAPPDPLAGTAAVLVAATDRGLARSVDGGASWAAAGGDLPEAPVVDLEPTPEALYAALTGAGVFLSRDRGETWHAAGALPDPAVRDLAAASSDHPTLWAATATGVFRSPDGGATWRDASPRPGLGIRTLAVDPADPDTVWAGTFTRGALVTRDGGASWQPASEGLASPDVRALAVDPFGSGTVAAATGEGVFVSRDGSGSWEPAAPGLPTGDVTAVAADPRVPGRWWAATEGRGVFVLDDASARPLQLHGGRFEARAAWRDLGGHGGAALPLPLTAASGAFRLFSESPDLAVKLLDARAVNGNFWLFAAPLTGAGLTLTVTDTASGASRTWDLPPHGGRLVIDPEAFPDTPSMGRELETRP